MGGRRIISNRVESDNKDFYCKYCNKCLHLHVQTRHNNSEMHKFNQICYKNDNICNQIYDRLVENFENYNRSRGRGNYLVGEERKQKFFEWERETWRLYEEARKDGYFDELDFDESIDFVHYDFYHRMGIKLNRRPVLPVEDYDSDDSDDED